RAVVGAQRFLQRLWRNIVSEETGELTVTDASMDEETARLLHRTSAGVRTELEEMRPHPPIARLTLLSPRLTGLPPLPPHAPAALVIMVAPFTPHIAEELWQRLGHTETITYEQFPQADPALLVEETVTCVVQINGKVRDRLEVSP